MRVLAPEIVEKLAEKLRKKPSTVRKDIYLLVSDYPGYTKNAVAQAYAKKEGMTVFRFLDDEDRASMAGSAVVRPIVVAAETRKPRLSRSRGTQKPSAPFLRISSQKGYQRDHIDEINRGYASKCYTACFILSRKVMENLIIDVLRARFPPSQAGNLSLYFDAARNRHHDFSLLLKNLAQKSKEFGPDSKQVERIVGLATPFKEEANDKAHSWYHVVKNADELDKMAVQDIIDYLEELHSKVRDPR